MKKVIYTMLAAALLSACSNKEQKTGEETLRVNVEKVAPAADFNSTPFVGVVEEEQSTMVSFTGMAVLKSVKVNEGQNVHKGQLLATIDDAQARHALEAAKSSLDQALDAQARMKQLHEKNSLPDMKWVEVESKVQQSQASYALCKKNLEDCTIYAPCSGVVGSKIMGVGETVLPSEPVLNILSINKVKVRVSIPEREIAAITSQTPSTITVDALPGETFVGGAVEKGVSADAMTHTYDIRILLDNPGHKLLPGMVAKVMLKEGDPEATAPLTLPVKAIQQAADKSLFVWVVKDGKAQRKAVNIGKTNGNRVAIESGLDEGETVITEGYQKVGEGMPVIF
ncbi:MAG: efflux RND transporter periplasmic adaptor subunit [Bacteroidaceae bacterium]|nr:efflux RND transporter periplasmic adaptor subunit [Bacteroidaceae bacterium]